MYFNVYNRCIRSCTFKSKSLFKKYSNIAFYNLMYSVYILFIFHQLFLIQSLINSKIKSISFHRLNFKMCIQFGCNAYQHGLKKRKSDFYKKHISWRRLAFNVSSVAGKIDFTKNPFTRCTKENGIEKILLN